MWPNPQFPAGLVKLIEKILNEKLHFLCRVAVTKSVVGLSKLKRRYGFRLKQQSYMRRSLFKIVNQNRHCVKSAQIEFLLVCIFPYSLRIRENTDQKKLRIWTFFTQCGMKIFVNTKIETSCIIYDVIINT